MTTHVQTAPAGSVSIEEIRSRVSRVPRLSFAVTDTPLQEMPRLAKELGIGRLFVKRDDLTGLAFGGNKTRNLEFRLAELVAEGADVMIAGLEAQSNSARQTTAACNLLGVQTILVLRTERDWGWQGNLLIDRILGADVRLVEVATNAELDEILRETAAEQRAKGKKPYVMNHAGAFAIGSALAYLLCTLEIVEQTARLGVAPSHLYMTSGNKGHAGLILARKLLGAHFRTIAISQRRGEDRVPGAIAGARDAARALGWDVDLQPSDVESYDDYVGDGYGKTSAAAIEAITLAARTEGLILDPVYTGKAMAGLIDHARRGLLGADETVVFIHTGGTPALFAFKDEIMEALGG
ncbi:MAG: pyridoxal-phosphate dependent enzyme [Chloroflexota bacterium]